MLPPHLRRRSATSVMAGNFDPQPARDVLTSLLNGVPPYPPASADSEDRKLRRKERRERRLREKGKQKADIDIDNTPTHEANAIPGFSRLSITPPSQSARGSTSSFWKAKQHPHPRPQINIATMQRSVSVTPPPFAFTSPTRPRSSPGSTPGPSSSSSTSRTSSKRPRTPDDDEEMAVDPQPRPPRKKRVAVKKGWKGWVEGEPEPSTKLINLDGLHIIQAGPRPTRFTGTYR